MNVPSFEPLSTFQPSHPRFTGISSFGTQPSVPVMGMAATNRLPDGAFQMPSINVSTYGSATFPPTQMPALATGSWPSGQSGPSMSTTPMPWGMAPSPQARTPSFAVSPGHSVQSGPSSVFMSTTPMPWGMAPSPQARTPSFAVSPGHSGQLGSYSVPMTTTSMPMGTGMCGMSYTVPFSAFPHPQPQGMPPSISQVSIMLHKKSCSCRPSNSHWIVIQQQPVILWKGVIEMLEVVSDFQVL